MNQKNAALRQFELIEQIINHMLTKELYIGRNIQFTETRFEFFSFPFGEQKQCLI